MQVRGTFPDLNLPEIKKKRSAQKKPGMPRLPSMKAIPVEQPASNPTSPMGGGSFTPATLPPPGSAARRKLSRR